MKESKKQDALVSFDINMRPKFWHTDVARRSCEEAFTLCDIVFAGVEDLGSSTGSMNRGSLRKLGSLGVGMVVVKHGA